MPIENPIYDPLRSPLYGPLTRAGRGGASPLSIVSPSFLAEVGAQPYSLNAANSNQVVASDADAGGGDFTFSITLTQTAESPTMTLAGVTGLTFTPTTGGDGTADAFMEFVCTVAEFNTAMDGATLQSGAVGLVSISYTMTDGTNNANRSQIASLSPGFYTLLDGTTTYTLLDGTTPLALLA